MEEQWKPVVGYEGLYEVSDLGRVKSLQKQWVSGNGSTNMHNGKILSQSKNKLNYRLLKLSKNGVVKTILVHILVAESFLNHNRKVTNMVVDHINDDPSDNRLCNLQVVSVRYNAYKTQGKYSSKYKGVSWHKATGKWYSRIHLNGKGVNIGLYEDEYEAHLAYQNALKKYNV